MGGSGRQPSSTSFLAGPIFRAANVRQLIKTATLPGLFPGSLRGVNFPVQWSKLNISQGKKSLCLHAFASNPCCQKRYTRTFTPTLARVMKQGVTKIIRTFQKKGPLNQPFTKLKSWTKSNLRQRQIKIYSDTKTCCNGCKYNSR